MKTINKFTIIASILLLSIFIGCSNFDDLNTNPDSTSQVSASLLCTNVVLRVARFDGRDAKVMIYDNALSKYVGYANERYFVDVFKKETNMTPSEYKRQFILRREEEKHERHWN